MKIERKTLPLVCPNPIILVTTIDKNKKANIITLTLAGGYCWEPPVIGIGIGKNQFSKDLVEELAENQSREKKTSNYYSVKEYLLQIK